MVSKKFECEYCGKQYTNRNRIENHEEVCERRPLMTKEFMRRFVG
jgi:methionyl-tRNA synthetase